MQIELLVADHAGAPIFSSKKTDATTTVAQNRTSPSDNPTLTVTNYEAKYQRTLYGVVLPTEQESRWVFLGIDGSAVLFELNQEHVSDESRHLKPTGNGIMIDPSIPLNSHLSYADQALPMFFTGHTLFDIRDNRKEMTEEINKAIDVASNLAQKRQENLLKALPDTINALKRYGQPPPNAQQP